MRILLQVFSAGFILGAMFLISQNKHPDALESLGISLAFSLLALSCKPN